MELTPNLPSICKPFSAHLEICQRAIEYQKESLGYELTPVK
jgi:hypothetical protein